MSHRNPVILLHGLCDSALLFDRLAGALRNKGWDVHTLDLIPNDGSAGIDELALQVGAYVETTLTPSQPFDLIGFSMGGLVARYCVQRLPRFKKVQRLITISAPHNGTWAAFLRRNRGARQMRPGSAFLRELNSDTEALKSIRFTSIWTPLDLMIIPTTSSRMAEGESVVVLVPAHALMMVSRRVLTRIEQALSIH